MVSWCVYTIRESNEAFAVTDGNDQRQVSHCQSLSLNEFLGPTHTTRQWKQKWNFSLVFAIYYHPQTKLWKGNVFTSVCQEFCRGGRGGLGKCTSHPLDQYNPSWADTPSRDGNCSRWYASYWNAFLFFKYFRFRPRSVWTVPWCVTLDGMRRLQFSVAAILFCLYIFFHKLCCVCVRKMFTGSQTHVARIRVFS